MRESADSAGDITELLQAWSEGDDQAFQKLVPLVYDELHAQAHRYLRRERAEHTLQTTALVHETFLKLVGQRDVNWESRAHFFWLAAELMRRILVDYARQHKRIKRGGEIEFLPLDSALNIAVKELDFDLLALDEALNRLSALDRQQCKIVELRYFVGFDIEETAKILSVSPATVKRDWNTAKAWLHHELRRSLNQTLNPNEA